MRSMMIFVLGAVLAVPTAHSEGMKPGLWEITSTNNMGGVSMPAIPPAALAKMKAMGVTLSPAMGGGQSMTIRHCATSAEAEKGVPPLPKNNDRMRCAKMEVTHEGNKVSWKTQCTGERAVTISGNAVYQSPESYSGTSTIITDTPPHGSMTMTSNFSARWVSASCQ